MQITVNGESRDVAPDTTVQALVESFGLDGKTVVVQRNEDIVERGDYAATLLEDGDNLDLIRFVGGG